MRSSKCRDHLKDVLDIIILLYYCLNVWKVVSNMAYEATIHYMVYTNTESKLKIEAACISSTIAS